MDGLSRGLITTILAMSGIILTYVASFQRNSLGIGAGLALVAAAGFSGVSVAVNSRRNGRHEDDDH